MIPVRLTIQGLYSYRKKQTIDFNQLTAAGLFGIFGGVGCGKSTILEAITFALYGESERLNNRENRYYNMMNLKSNELLIDYEFKTADNHHYRVIVKGKRNGRNFDEVKAFERSAYRFGQGEWQPMECVELVSVIGLNYDNFRRTVIIPQGRFQEFLQLGIRERTQMLQELFNLNKFDLSGKVVTLENKNNAQIQNINGQLQSIGIVKKEDLANREQQLMRIQQELKHQNKSLSVLRTRIHDFELLRDSTQKLEFQNQHLAELQKREYEIEQKEKEVLEYENFTRIFKSDLDQLQSIKHTLEETEAALVQLEKEKAQTEQSLNGMILTFDQTRKEYAQKDHFLQEADELKKAEQIHLAAEEIEKRKQLIIEAGERIKTIEQSVLTDKQLLSQLKEETERIQKNLPDWSLLSSIRKWFAEHKGLLSNQKRSENLFVELTNQLQSVKEKAVLRFQNAFPQSYTVASDVGEKLENGQMSLFSAPRSSSGYSEEKMEELIKQKRTELKEQEDLLRGGLTELKIRNELHRYAADLSEGDPCPLCGSVHHPGILKEEYLSEKIKKEEESLRTVLQKTERLNRFEQDFIQTRTQVNALMDQIKSGQEKITADREMVETHNALFDHERWTYTDERSVNEAFDHAEQINEKLKQQTAQLDDLRKQIEKEGKDRETATGERELLDKKQVETETRINLLSAQLKRIRIGDYAEWSSGMIDEKIRQLQAYYDTLLTRYRKEEEELTALRTRKGTLNGSIDIHRKNIDLQKTRQKQLVSVIEANLQRQKLGSVELVVQTLNRQLDTVRYRQEIEQFRKDKEVTLQQVRQLTEQLAGRKYQQEEHQKTVSAEQELAEKVNEQTRQLGMTEQEIRQLRERLQKSEELNAVLNRLTLRAEDIKTLKTLFRSSAFVNYVSTVYLSSLCKAANERFYKLTRQKLRLELTEDNNFQVCDFMNEGKVRSVKTLSGGQTFQASLSLALALADSIHQVSSGYENFFFLDEGFGTLDKDSLDIVFETLKSLRKENRIVGVISHVEEMQQEIETYLRVTNNETEGSMIVPSWKE